MIPGTMVAKILDIRSAVDEKSYIILNKEIEPDENKTL